MGGKGSGYSSSEKRFSENIVRRVGDSVPTDRIPYNFDNAYAYAFFFDVSDLGSHDHIRKNFRSRGKSGPVGQFDLYHYLSSFQDDRLCEL